MKCEKCNEREATLFYKADINGEKTEKHLCAQCAKEEGFGELLERHSRDVFGGFFDDPFRGFFDDDPFFAGFSRLGRSLMAPMLTLPRLSIELTGEPEAKTASEKTAGKTETASETDAELSKKRELKALKHQLHEAVKNEEFEKCVELRDKIREMEQE